MFTFFIFYVMPPSDPARRFAGKSPTAETLEAVREEFGLDKPWYRQYGLFVTNLVTGDEYGWPGLGFSYDTGVPVKDQLFDRLPRTLFLAIGAAILWAIMGITIGVISGDQEAAAWTGPQWGSPSSACPPPSSGSASSSCTCSPTPAAALNGFRSSPERDTSRSRRAPRSGSST